MSKNVKRENYGFREKTTVVSIKKPIIFINLSCTGLCCTILIVSMRTETRSIAIRPYNEMTFLNFSLTKKIACLGMFHFNLDNTFTTLEY